MDTAARTDQARALGHAIVAHQREARFGEISAEEWVARLTALIAAQPGVSGAITISDLRPAPAAAGGSNGTLLFTASYATDGAAQQADLVLRFLPVAGLFKRYDVAGQFALQRALESTPVPVPRQHWLDATGTYLKAPGYVMEQVQGVNPPMAWKASGLLVDSPPAVRRQMMMSYIDMLAKIHAVDWEAAGLGWLRQRAAGARPIEREINWYWDSLVWAAVDDYVERLSPIRDWLIAHEPSDFEVVLCHGDCNFGNYLFVGGKVTAVLDWEMAFLGSPECDLAFLKVGDENLQSGLATPDGALSFDEMYAAYERASGRTLRHMAYFEMFTAYRGAVINVLAMRHFTGEVAEVLIPVMRRGVQLSFDRASAMKII